MPDFPGIAIEIPHVNLNTVGVSSMLGQVLNLTGGIASATSAWPAIDRAIYCPVQVDIPINVVKMAFQVGIQSGNYDIGIYDEHGNRMVSLGSTTVPVAGIAIADIADTVLMPGVYFFALCVDNVTATIQRSSLAATSAQICGVQQQALGSVVLPATATFANPASAYIPVISAMAVATI